MLLLAFFKYRRGHTLKRVMANRIRLHNVSEFRAETDAVHDGSMQQRDFCPLAHLSRYHTTSFDKEFVMKIWKRIFTVYLLQESSAALPGSTREFELWSLELNENTNPVSDLKKT